LVRNKARESGETTLSRNESERVQKENEKLSELNAKIMGSVL